MDTLVSEPSRLDGRERFHGRAEGGLERSGGVLAHGRRNERRDGDSSELPRAPDDLVGGRLGGEVPVHGDDLDLVRIATDVVTVAAEDVDLLRNHVGPPKKLQASAYRATRRSVFFSPPPPIRMRGRGLLAGIGLQSVSASW